MLHQVLMHQIFMHGLSAEIKYFQIIFQQRRLLWYVRLTSVHLLENPLQRCATGGRRRVGGTLTGGSCGVHWPSLTSKPHPLNTRPPFASMPAPLPPTCHAKHMINFRGVSLRKFVCLRESFGTPLFVCRWERKVNPGLCQRSHSKEPVNRVCQKTLYHDSNWFTGLSVL